MSSSFSNNYIEPIGLLLASPFSLPNVLLPSTYLPTLERSLCAPISSKRTIFFSVTASLSLSLSQTQQQIDSESDELIQRIKLTNK
ncbi:hypothetical protein RchiOBHm_Chr6g0274141 [Rosa chinensis]|uniref:Uncharacterized protein n=1 Tax=Rosa chinensis TaxID=74649 RepID=A0A2P6PRP5_ROSCH|nr:hypothetical protein RchiOBHm_Chr6g0274141 [Rosa chinensis]